MSAQTHNMDNSRPEDVSFDVLKRIQTYDLDIRLHLNCETHEFRLELSDKAFEAMHPEHQNRAESSKSQKGVEINTNTTPKNASFVMTE